MKYWIVAAHVSLALPAIAMDARHPDWPCPQIVVPKLSVAAFWTGPSIDDVGDTWMKDQTVHDLVLRFAGRRTSLTEAEKEAAEFIVGTQAERQQRADGVRELKRKSRGSGFRANRRSRSEGPTCPRYAPKLTIDAFHRIDSQMSEVT